VHFTPAELAAVTPMTPGPTTVQSHNDNQPAPDNPATCPLCQEMLHSGSFVMPAAIGALPPGLAFSAVVPALAQRIGLHFLSHNWYGRAPPAV
jgi:hypothetical protein